MNFQNKLMANKVIKRFAKAFGFSGLVLIVYSLFVKFALDNPDFGSGFDNVDVSFTLADIFLIWGLIRLLTASTYLIFSRVDKIQLNDKLVKHHFIFTSFFPLVVMVAPLLDTYYPESSDTIFADIITYYSIFSFFAFIYGVGTFVYNLIKSTVVYFFIKNK